MNPTNKPTPMPRVANMPAPMPVPTQGRPQPKSSAAEFYDPEVLRIVQADVDRKRKIAELESDRDDWRRQALDAKQEVKRLEMVLARDHKEFEELLRKERAENDEAVERIGHERDVFKGEVVRIKTCAQNGAAVFLQILDDGLSVSRAEQVGQQAVAEEIDREQAKPGGDEFPRVVTAGPRESES